MCKIMQNTGVVSRCFCGLTRKIGRLVTRNVVSGVETLLCLKLDIETSFCSFCMELRSWRRICCTSLGGMWRCSWWFKLQATTSARCDPIYESM